MVGDNDNMHLVDPIQILDCFQAISFAYISDSIHTALKTISIIIIEFNAYTLLRNVCAFFTRSL